MEIIAIVDRNGLPLLVNTHVVNYYEVKLVQLNLDCYIIEANPNVLIGNSAYDGGKLDKELSDKGIKMVESH